MLKDFLKRIITEVIKELISPELTILREEIKKVEGSLKETLNEMREDMRHLDTRLDDLYKVVVRREEHYSLEEDVKKLREDVELLKRRVGA